MFVPFGWEGADLMNKLGRWARVVGWSGAVLLGAAIPISAEEAPHPLSNPKPAFGLVTDFLGTPMNKRASDPAGMVPLKIGDIIATGDELHIGQGGKLELLWDHRALVALCDDARATIGEAHYGQADVRLYQGTVRIALSYNAGRVTDTLTLRTQLATVTTRGGIMESTVPNADRRSFFTGLLNGVPGETIRVLEGTARIIEPLSGDGRILTLNTGSEVSVKMGKRLSVSETEMTQMPPQPLAIREEHRQVPRPVMRQIVNAQVGAALETGQAFVAAVPGTEKDPVGTAPKGVILATTAGVPLTSLFPSPSTSGTIPSTSSPQVAPLVPGANVGSLGPAQSGGLNSRGILTEILKDVGKRGRGSRNK